MAPRGRTARWSECARTVGGSRPAAMVSKATWKDQRSVRGPVADVARLANERSIESPATLIVGEVAKVRADSTLQLAASL